MEKHKIAHNKCCRCGFEWKDFPGSFAQIGYCTKCGSLYFNWINYNNENWNEEE